MYSSGISQHIRTVVTTFSPHGSTNENPICGSSVSLQNKQTLIFQYDGLSSIFVSKKRNITFEIVSLMAELKERFIRTFIRLWENVIPPLPYRKLHTYPPLLRLILH